MMGFYLMPGVAHTAMDKHRGNFFWNSSDNKRKYRLVRWSIIFKPKDRDGLGILDTKVMNTFLIIKWWWKILTIHPETLWHRILQARYFPNASPLFASGTGGSQFWR